RYFTVKGNSLQEDVSQFVASRHLVAWARYEARVPLAARSKESYVEFLRHDDVELLGIMKSLAPTLYFDFVGASGREYVLDSLEVVTMSFDEYSGGGFFDSEAWYDVTLQHRPGKQEIGVNKRLRFTGSGRAQLRF